MNVLSWILCFFGGFEVGILSVINNDLVKLERKQAYLKRKALKISTLKFTRRNARLGS